VTVLNIAIAVDGLSEHWLGGVNYFRNLVTVFDAAAEPGLRLHVLTDEPGFFNDLHPSPRVVVHGLGMLKRKSLAWVLRKALMLATGRDTQLLAHLKHHDVRAVLFKYVEGASAVGIPTMPWIPDFQFKHLPELFPPSVVTALQKKAQLYIRNADGLILSSQAACDDAVSLFGADRRKLHVLRFAPKVDFKPLQLAALRDEVFARHGIARPYVFLPNQYWQHKNHQLVVQALKLLRDEGRPAPLIVSTGKTEDPRTPAYFTEFEAGVRAQGLTADYRILGVIPRQDMLVLLAHSLAVLNPSRFKGWSTTVEEAKSLGKPLLVSNIAVHREQVAGRGDALCFGTDDASALAAQLEGLARRHASDAATSHPPWPDPSLHTVFMTQNIALLRTVVSAHKVAV
jgi:glycosyltransferase involved in cell wall biosynthesis